ncbi:dihydroorotase [Halocella sp. SP3-1]|uniref:dihydroorotase n=1 Tax=Halocella sp. SP3-1 TaxID=2382161 RepID=UPI000F7656FE|nr:dihydroorotase [Halocella sp. SP3-1]AZO95494.1 dihydroorotase [Halocella sp. SP3-1]
MKKLFKNAFIIDPLNDLTGKYDLLLDADKIVAIKKEINQEDCMIIDLKGKILLPGLIDMHTHLREPGFEEKETIKTGCEAAAAGGFTTIACMPNTNPVADNQATIEYIKARAKEAVVNVIPIGSITKGSSGKELAEIGFLSEAGVKAISDDGNPVMNSEIMRRAMEYASSFSLPVISHCEDKNLAGDGVMHEGYYSTILGLKGIPAAAEEVMIARDIILAEMTGAHLHIAHLSTARGVELLRDAKKRGLKITAEVTPHHLLLTDQKVKGYNPDTKVNPPLRSDRDRKALCKGLKDGIIDVIATDHAPHTYEDKLGEYDLASFGISGLETALSLLYDNFIDKNVFTWEELLDFMAYGPAEILGIKHGGLKKGSTADITVFDPDISWKVSKEKMKSRGKNTPFANNVLQGRVVLTVVKGNIVYNNMNGEARILYDN